MIDQLLRIAIDNNMLLADVVMIYNYADSPEDFQEQLNDYLKQRNEYEQKNKTENKS